MEIRVQEIFDKQVIQQHVLRRTTVEERIAKLKKLKKTLLHLEKDIFQALQLDLRKHEKEAAITEVYFIYSEIDFAIKHLRRWMGKQHKSASITNLLAKNWTQFEPKGISLILSPWNYPFQLSMSPLLSAVAAGCAVLLKPSEFSPHTAEILKEIISQTFPVEEVTCLLGDKELATELLNLPVANIFFTGSPSIGKIVMKAASNHLSGLTLELGGKSPVLIDKNYPLKDAAQKIAWGKLINAGQTCIAPDYILMPKEMIPAFVSEFAIACQEMFYNVDQSMDTNKYAKIINTKHLNRLKELIAELNDSNGTILWQSNIKDQESFPATLVQIWNVNSRIMDEEIFGPILPIVGFDRIDEALAIIQNKPKPLALYIFSNSTEYVTSITQACSSGSVCINDVLLQVSNPNLPFGGINTSGMGSCHGFYGFKAFSHERAMMKQSKWSITKLIYPPYKNKDRIFKFLKSFM